MLPHRQRANEQVVLLHVGRQSGQGAAAHGDAVDSPSAAHLEVRQRAEHQGVQQSRLTRTTSTHDGQQLSWMCHATDCKAAHTETLVCNITVYICCALRTENAGLFDICALLGYYAE